MKKHTKVYLTRILSYAILNWRGLELMFGLGLLWVGCFLVSRVERFGFNHDERHHNKEWALETGAIFVGFFAVVAWIHAGLGVVAVSHTAAVPVVISIMAGADNAAATAAVSPLFEGDDTRMLWFALFNAVVYGASTIAGNGPQIICFIVVLTTLGMVKPIEIAKQWMREIVPIFPYMLTWTVGIVIIVNDGILPTPRFQLLVGVLALIVGYSSLELKADIKKKAKKSEVND